MSSADGVIAVSLVDALQPKEEEASRKEAAAKPERRQRPSFANVPTPFRSGRSAGGAGAPRGPARGGPGGLEDVLRRKGVDEAWNALEEMQRNGVTSDKFTVSRLLMKTVGDGRFKLNVPRTYRCIGLVQRFIDSQPRDVDEVLFNALLDISCRLRDLSWTEATVKRMQELSVKPSPVTLGILVKTYGQAGDIQKVLQVWSEMDEQRRGANAVTYGCMIDACVKCGRLDVALEIFADMKEEGRHKNTVLYTTLIKGCGLEKDLQKALELFHEMTSEGVPHNAITYNSILEACVKCNDLTVAEGLLEEMLSSDSSVEPDLITFSTIIKGYCYAGYLEKALKTLESIKSRGLHCDELVYNTLIDGCVKACDIDTGVRVFEEMIAAGLRPSTVTHGILMRLHLRAAAEDEANDAVAQLYQRSGIERPAVGADARRGAERPGRGRPSTPTAQEFEARPATPTAPPATPGLACAQAPYAGAGAPACATGPGWAQQGYAFGPMMPMAQHSMMQPGFTACPQTTMAPSGAAMSPFPMSWPMMGSAQGYVGEGGLQVIAVPVMMGPNGEARPQFPMQQQGGQTFFPMMAASSPESAAPQAQQPQPQMMFMQPMQMMQPAQPQPQFDACGGQWFPC